MSESESKAARPAEEARAASVGITWLNKNRYTRNQFNKKRKGFDLIGS
jgi:hypothetical protein